MIEVNEQMVVAIERLRAYGDAFLAVAKNNPPRFAELYPVEHAGLRQVAQELRTFGFAEFDRLAFRTTRLAAELDEADRMARDRRIESRQYRKQRELVARSYTQFADAWDALFEKLVEKGVRVRDGNGSYS